MVRVLRRLGYPVRFAVVPGGHDYASWRAVFDPHLPDLVRAAVFRRTRMEVLIT